MQFLKHVLLSLDVKFNGRKQSGIREKLCFGPNIRGTMRYLTLINILKVKLKNVH